MTPTHTITERRDVPPLTPGGGEAPSDERAADLARLPEAWNRTDAPFPRDLCIHDLFAAQAARTPDAEAVLHADARLTYAGLDARANRIARRLQRLGVGPEVRVGICLERGVEMVAAILGVLKAGGAYVPLDPAYPVERLSFTLRDASVAVLLTQERLRGLLPAAGDVRIVSVDGGAREIAAESADAPPSGADPRNLAYLIYTSGSTGVPKGVAIEHESAVALLAWAGGVFTADERSGVLAATSICFDLSVFEIFLPLTRGGRIILVENALAVATSALAGEVRLINTVPSAIAALLRNGGIPASATTVNLAGEPLRAELADALYAHGGIERVYDLYGPSEDTTYSTWTLRTAGGPEIIGQPIENTRAHVLDGAMRPVAPGTAGELYLAGSGLARGYLGRPALTADRFVPDPFGHQPGGRLYRTGDRVRLIGVHAPKTGTDVTDCDGSTYARSHARTLALQYLGRLDSQVKVRGFRIELGEVEARLREHAGVGEAVVVAREDTPGDRRLVAYVVADRAGVEAIEAESAEWEAGHQADWSAAWDHVYGRVDAGADPAFDISGWNSSFTGQPLPAEEMREWVDATVARIATLGPRRVLEIGCGTGLLLWRLAPGCERYVGTDISARVVAHLQALRSRHPELAHVETSHRAADDLAGFEPASFDTVVINSVVQYLPSLDSLSRVIEGAARLVSPGGRIFVGDVRDLRLLGAFRTAVETHASPPDRTVAEWRERAEQAQAQEAELVIDPAFFRSLPRSHGGITSVETLQKRGRFSNELTAFRYDAILHVRASYDEVGEDGAWLDWDIDGLTQETIAARLAADDGDSLVVLGVPNVRVTGALKALEIRRDPRGVETVADVRRLAVADGVDPEALWRLGETLGWRVSVRLSDDAGRVDVRFARADAARHPFLAQAPRERAAPATYATDPLRGRRARVLIPALRRHLAERLPAYMAPAAYVVLETMPLTPNGKVDRKALPSPDAEVHAGAYEPPLGETEAALADVWSEVLGVARIGRRDHFLEIGGHSLAAMQVISRIRRVFGAEVTQSDLFGRPVLADLARFIEGAERAHLLPLERADRSERLPLSFAQARLWFLDQLGDAGAAYHVPMGLRLRGTLDRAALVRALDRIVARHEALRTTFAEEDGEPVQRIAPADGAVFPLAEEDLAGAVHAEAALARLAETEAHNRFDLRRGPLARGRLVRLAQDEHVLLVTMHHIVSDGWSMGVLADELSALYAAFVRGERDPLPPPSAQYAEYVAWQRRWMDGEVLSRDAAYWREALAGIPALLELPTDRPRPPRQDHAGGVVPVAFGAELSAAVRALGRRHGTTPFMTVLAAWGALLGRLAAHNDVVIGTPAANRPRTELEGLIGLFLNTLALRADLSGAPTVAGLLARVKQRALAAQQHQHLPFEQVVELLHPARSLSHTPVFQVFFTWENVPQGRFELPGVRVTPLERAGRATAKFDLSLFLEEEDGRIVGGIEYATALFDRETVERWAGFLGRLMEGMAAGDQVRIDRLPLLSTAERRVIESAAESRRVRPANAYIPFSPEDLEQTIHQRFHAQVAAHPRRTALRTRGGEWSYAQLDALARAVARSVVSSIGVRDAQVGLLFDPGAPMVAAILGALMAGKTYVPLDPAWPEPRMRRVLDDAGARTILADPAHFPDAQRLADSAESVLRVDAHLSLAEDIAHFEAVDTPPGAIAYLLYTSGSTGEPKGVAQSHRNVLGHIRAYTNALRIAADDRMAMVASYATDAAVMDLFGALLNGASLHLFDVREEGIERLAPWLRAEGVTIYHSTPTLFRALARQDGEMDDLSTVRLVVLGGEAVFRPDFERFRRAFQPGAILVNGLGPTESTLALQEMMDHGARPHGHGIPAGRAVDGAEVLLLDDAGEPAEVYAPGEIVIRGPNVALGYWGRPALTAQAFVPDPASPGARMYRTGDVGRRLPDGRVEFLGRRDEQVKVRGYRVEPDEVAAVLRRIPGVHAAAVVARTDSGETRLVAYVVTEASVRIEDLRTHVAERLPEYMVPAAYVRLDALPLTSSAKLDRRALPAPGDDAYSRRRHEPPEGDTERTLASVWSDLLGVGRVGRWDDFFALGGHSLMAVQAVSRVRRALGMEATVRDLFAHPVLADFAGFLAGANRAEPDEIVRAAAAEERAALSFAQQRLWFLEQMGGVGTAYHVGRTLRLRGALDRAALLRALDRIVARHEALRTTFPQTDGGPVQRIAPVEASGFRVIEHDLRGRVDAEAELARIVAAEGAAPFDLEAGPLARARLVRLADADHALVIRMHHAVSDAWSTGVFLAELGALYAAFHAGRADPLPPLPVQYADWAAWQRRRVAGDVLEAQARYWTDVLAGAPEVLELPADRSRPPRQDHAGASIGVELDVDLAAAIHALAQRHGATVFMVLLAGWAIVLGRLSGHDDIVIGTPSANRGGEEVEGLIGFFVNTLALRVDLGGAPTVDGLLARVKARALEAQQHQDIPFEQVVERVRPARSLAYTPLFQAMLTWQNAPSARLHLPGIDVAELDDPAQETAKFDLSLSLADAGGRIAGELAYAAALFDRATVERWAGYLRAALTSMAADDSLRVDDVPMLSAEERRRVVDDWNATAAAYPADDCIHRLITAQARRTPSAVAVVHEGAQLTYAQVDGSATRLARELRRGGVGRGSFVPVLAERGPAAPIAMLAAMKAGAAFVPLDPSWPEERLHAAIRDLDPSTVLADAASAGRAVSFGRPVLVAEIESGEPSLDREVLDGGVGESDAIYAIYTSGSTGVPKAAVVHHGGIANRFGWMTMRFGAESAACVLQTTRHVYDSAIWQLFWPMVHGGRTVIPRDGGEADAGHILSVIASEGVTMTDFVPSVFNALVPDLVVDENARAQLASLRTVVVGGEQITPPTVWRFLGALPGVRVVNLYGPTECSIGSICHEARPGDGDRIPIGTPISNTRALVLDRRGRPVPRGAAGEIHLGGRCVGLGYRGDARKTAAAFVPDPFGPPGARLYRTGDLGRHLADGSIEYLGRIDQQVKIRGVRIEPGEIEARLRAHAGVLDAAVVARDAASGDRRLVAYVVGAAADADELRAHIAAHLPDPMVPAAFVWLDALPLTPNGKLDRRALPEPDEDATARTYEAPVGPAESVLAEIWAEVLGVERVGRRDHFFERGGHSLLAVRLLSRVRRLIDAGATLRDLFERPVLADFARGLAMAGVERSPIEPADLDRPLPLSPAQRRLWFLEQLGGLGGAWHVSERLRLRGALDVDALRRALDRIAARHETLRTSFAIIDGEPEQRVAPASSASIPLAVQDIAYVDDVDATLRRIVIDEARALFDLAHGPLIRGRLVRLAEEDHALLLTMHHLVSDGWSTDLLVHELGALYAAFVRNEADPLSPLPVQYADYAAWHLRRVDAGAFDAQEEYWHRALSGAPTLLSLPTDRPRPARQDPAGETLMVAFDDATSDAVRALSRRHGATPFMVVLAAWSAVLGRLAGQDDVVIGTLSANRGREEVEAMIGFFVDTLALRVDLSGSPSTADLVARVRARTLEAQQHADLPFERVVERVRPARSLTHHPLFQVMLSWDEARRSGPLLPGLRAEPLGGMADAAARFDLWLALRDVGGRIAGDVTYAAALFDRATVERWLGSLSLLLREMSIDDRRPVDRLPLVSDSERWRLISAWNATETAYPRDLCIHQLFEAQAARTPNAVAVVTERGEMTYAELDVRAGRLARRLRALGVGLESRVALCVDPGAEMVIALLGVMKVDGAYVPLDPSHPADRLAYVLHDAAPAAVLVHGQRRPDVNALLTALHIPVIHIDDTPWEDDSAARETAVGADHPAYVMYTSGSTGRPKGVVVPHRGVVNLLLSMAERIELAPEDRLLSVTTYAFDISVLEIFLPLLFGARTIVLPRERVASPSALTDAIRAYDPTLMQATPATWRMLAEAGWEGAPALRVLCGGEALPVELARAIRGRVGALWNVYGPTETTIWSTAEPVDAPADSGVVPIGRPVANTRIYVLDGYFEPVPVGAPGEVFIAGNGVARGYLHRPALTAERFIPDPYASRPGTRMYRTGDLGRWLADGRVIFAGRADHQVKVRGFRIEPGEIEARLREHPSVRQAVVMAREDAPGETRLVAYVATDGAIESLRAHLATLLPEYMVPAAFVRLDTLPLTPNGKLDRAALPAPGDGAYARRDFEPPLGDTEGTVAAIWSAVLGVERVGRHDHFFDLGGHSLRAVRVISRVREALGVDARLDELFARPVLADFARALDTAAPVDARARIAPCTVDWFSDEEVDSLLGDLLSQRNGGARIPRRSGTGPRTAPVSFAQQRLLFLEELEDLGSTYHIPLRLALKGDLNVPALRRALDRIVARHESLCTTFGQVDGTAVQRIHDPAGFALAESDLLPSPDGEGELRRLISEETRAKFDLARGPLVRGRLIRTAADAHVLLITLHHIVSDGWSMEVLERELAALYGAFARGEEDPLPAPPIQYADYAAWQRDWLDGEAREAQAGYWVETLAGAPELLELPSDRPRPSRQDFTGASVDFDLDASLTASLRALSQRQGTTLFMTLLAGWSIVLGRLSGQDDVVIGTPSANRGRAEVEELIGFFINTLPIRVDLSGAPTAGGLLARVKARALEAQQHQDIPFEQVVERMRPVRSLAHSPLVQVMFSWQNAPGERPGWLGLQSSLVTGSVQEAAKFDLTLTLSDRGERISGGLIYATSLFERETVVRYMGYLRRVLEGMVACDAVPVDRLPLMPEAERARVVDEWNRTEAEYPREACIHERFERQVTRTPGATAVVSACGEVTYAELNARANRLAHYLRERGVGPGVRVGLCAERSPAMIVGILGVLKAGGVFVPLDPSFPRERIGYLLADCEPIAVLAQARFRDRFDHTVIPLIELDAADPAWANHPPANPDRGALTPSHPAYVTYTSGSTGRPKGVPAVHHRVLNLVHWYGRELGISERDGVLLVLSYSFDGTYRNLFAPLFAGGRLHLASEPFDPASIVAQIAEGSIGIVNLTPTAFQALAEADRHGALAKLRTVILVGEPVQARTLMKLPEPRPEVVNFYGPTECSGITTFHRLSRDLSRHLERPVPAGRPISNARIYILDPAGNPVPPGVAGEVHIGGTPVGPGYLARPEQTAERFIADPFVHEPGARMYSTGDLARWLPDGAIELVGRTDHQVKIRGYRVELGEIEARLSEHPAVRQAAVVAREDAPGETRLVAYHVGDAAPETLQAHLAASLPAYMVPAAYVRLAALPLTNSGKLDRTALPAPGDGALARRGDEPPRGTTEAALAEIWAEVLGIERVGRRDHFFDLGGHSLLAVRLVERVRERVAPAMALDDIFAHPTLEALAARLDGKMDWLGSDHAIPVRETGSQPPLLVVHDMTGLVAYAQLLRPHLDADVPIYALSGPLNSTARIATMDDLVDRLVRMVDEVQPEGPYRLAGWSAGGVFAYALAQRLVEMGRTVELLAMMDTSHPERRLQRVSDRARQFVVLDLLARDSAAPAATPEALRALRDATEGYDLPAFIGACHARGLLPETVTVARAEQVWHRIALLRRSSWEFVPRPLPVPIHFFSATGEVRDDPLRGWREMPGGGPIRLERVPGTHGTMWRKGNVEVLGAALSRAIRASARAG